MKNKLRRRRGLSMSGLRRIEKILAQGPRAFYRQFDSATRQHLKERAEYGP